MLNMMLLFFAKFIKLLSFLVIIVSILC